MLYLTNGIAFSNVFIVPVLIRFQFLMLSLFPQSFLLGLMFQPLSFGLSFSFQSDPLLFSTMFLFDSDAFLFGMPRFLFRSDSFFLICSLLLLVPYALLLRRRFLGLFS